MEANERRVTNSDFLEELSDSQEVLCVGTVVDEVTARILGGNVLKLIEQ